MTAVSQLGLNPASSIGGASVPPVKPGKSRSWGKSGGSGQMPIAQSGFGHAPPPKKPNAGPRPRLGQGSVGHGVPDTSEKPPKTNRPLTPTLPEPGYDEVKTKYHGDNESTTIQSTKDGRRIKAVRSDGDGSCTLEAHRYATQGGTKLEVSVRGEDGFMRPVTNTEVGTGIEIIGKSNVGVVNVQTPPSPLRAVLGMLRGKDPQWKLTEHAPEFEGALTGSGAPVKIYRINEDSSTSNAQMKVFIPTKSGSQQDARGFRFYPNGVCGFGESQLLNPGHSDSFHVWADMIPPAKPATTPPTRKP